MWHGIAPLPGTRSLTIHLPPPWHRYRKFDWFISPVSLQFGFNETVIANSQPALKRQMWEKAGESKKIGTEYVTQCAINPTHAYTEIWRESEMSEVAKIWWNGWDSQREKIGGGVGENALKDRFIWIEVEWRRSEKQRQMWKTKINKEKKGRDGFRERRAEIVKEVIDAGWRATSLLIARSSLSGLSLKSLSCAL